MKRYLSLNVAFFLILTIVVFGVAVFGAIYTNKISDSPIRISEICIHNKTVAYDENGDYGTDYIELYNASSEDFNLKGYGLSDTVNDPYRYTFPDISIAPGETIIFWGRTNPDNVSLYRDDYISHYIGFALSAGEICVLTDDEGKLVEAVALPDIPVDLSYQITTDDMNHYVVGTPSIGKLVSSEDIRVAQDDTNVPIPMLSFESGFYDEPFVLEISCGKGCDIFYTLDSTKPTLDSDIYSGGIEIYDRSSEENVYSNIGNISIWNEYLPDYKVDKGTVVRAMAVNNKGECSDVVTAVYFVGFQNKGYSDIPIISIVTEPDNLFSDYDGIYVTGGVYENWTSKYVEPPTNYVAHYVTNFSKRGKGWERPAEVIYFDSSREKIFQQNLGLRIHGSSSAAFTQKSFGLFADVSDEMEIHCDFFGEGKYYDEIILKGGDVYQTKMREAVVTRLFDDSGHMGLQKTQLCVVFLNGEYWGAYNLQEKIGESYIQNQYGIPYDNVVYIKNGEINTGDAEDYAFWTNLTGFISSNDMSLPENYEYIKGQMDIQSYIDFLCIEIYTGNCDVGDTYNAAAFRSREYGGSGYNDGKWRWLHVDMDGNTNIIKNYDYSHDDVARALEQFPIFANLLNNTEFKQQFIQSFMKYANNEFDYDHVHKVLCDMADEYRIPVVKSQQRFRGEFVVEGMTDEYMFMGDFSEADFDMNLRIIDEYYKHRYGEIMQYLKNDLGLE